MGQSCEDQTLQHAEIAQLKRENSRLEEEVACLNKAALCWVLRETTQVNEVRHDQG
jgi:cell division protein FtsB